MCFLFYNFWEWSKKPYDWNEKKKDSKGNFARRANSQSWGSDSCFSNDLFKKTGANQE